MKKPKILQCFGISEGVKDQARTLVLEENGISSGGKAGSVTSYL